MKLHQATAERLALRHIRDGLVLTTREAWAYFTVPTVPYEWLGTAERVQRAHAVATALQTLASAPTPQKGWRIDAPECHLLVVPGRFDLERWRSNLTPDGTASRWYEGYVADTYAYLSEQQARDRIAMRTVLLGVCLGSRHRKPTALRWLESAAGVDDDRATVNEIAGWERDRDAYARVLAEGVLRAQPAPVEVIASAIRRPFWRGLEEDPAPPLDDDAHSDLQSLVESTIVNHRRYLEVGQGDERAWVTNLAFSSFPRTLSFPGGEWLARCALAPFPVDASVRFRVVPAQQAMKDARRTIDAARDQLEHARESGVEPSMSASESYDEMRQIEQSIGRGMPLVYTWPRLTVWASTREEMDDRARVVVQDYANLKIGLVRPAGGQLSLFLESLPGERRRLAAYEQRQGLITLAGSAFWASAGVGDEHGPYVGFSGMIRSTAKPGSSTKFERLPHGRAEALVFYSPLNAARANQPTVFACTGKPGGGKTNLALLLALQMTGQGAAVVYVDPKEDTNGLLRLPQLRDRSQLLRLDRSHRGLLDPFAVATSREEGRLLAMDALTGLLLTAGELEEDAVTQACKVAAGNPKPSLAAAIDALRNDRDATAQRLARRFEHLAELPGAEMVFGAGTAAELRPEPGTLTLLQLEGLRLPDEGTRIDDYRPQDRLAVVCMRMLVSWTLRLADESRALSKCIVLDEAWAFVRSAEGRRLVERIGRTGRSKNIALGLLTQNAGDLLNSTIRNSVSAAFCFGAADSAEVGDVLDLLRVDDSPAFRDRITRLPRGTCVCRDAVGRVGTLHVDLVRSDFGDAFDTTPGRTWEVAACA